MNAILLFLAVVSGIGLPVALSVELESFADYRDAEETLSQLVRDKVTKLSGEDIARVIRSWRKSTYRFFILENLKKNGIDPFSESTAIMIERGNNEFNYEALYVSNRVFFFKSNQNKKLHIYDLQRSDSFNENIQCLKDIILTKEYLGDIYGLGGGVDTYLLTVLKDKKIMKTVIFYKAATGPARRKKLLNMNLSENEIEILKLNDILFSIFKETKEKIVKLE